jgi:CHAT domain-containing protein/tetratricopeptide (TPR) repeat protein
LKISKLSKTKCEDYYLSFHYNFLITSIIPYNTSKQFMCRKNLDLILDELWGTHPTDDSLKRIKLYRQALKKVDFKTQSVWWARLQFELANTLMQNLESLPPDSTEQAIFHYLEADKVFKQKSFHQDFALNIYNLGLAYLQHSQNRSENIEKAISCLKEAAEHYSSEIFPEAWATIQERLGVAYLERSEGIRAENFEQAISYLLIAAKVFTQTSFPKNWSDINIHLATAYYERILGDREQNIERAIYHCKKAAKFYSYKAFPEEWARIQDNLGNSFLERIKGKKVKNIEQAIYYFKQSFKVYIRENFPKEYAMTMNTLGKAYVQRMRGNREKNIEKSIFLHHSAAQINVKENFLKELAETLTFIGDAYYHRIKGERGDNIEQALLCFHQSAELYSTEPSSEEWIWTQQNLGNTYTERIHGVKSENIEEAIFHSKQALKGLNQEAFPYMWASLQNTLGKAYFERICGYRKENIEQAIHHYTQASQSYLRLGFSEDWAIAQSNLGGAYFERIESDRSENIEQAIFFYLQASQVFTIDSFPLNWAMIQSFLGAAYSVRIKDDRAQNIEIAISYFLNTTKVYTIETSPIEWALMQNNLGSAYGNRVHGDSAQNVEKAVFHFTEAIKVYSLESFPEDWAMIQINLGSAFANQTFGDRAVSIEKAIFHFSEAIQIFTRETFPIDWANTCLKLGIAYAERLRGDKEVNIEKAFKYLQSALIIYTPDQLPLKSLEVLTCLGGVSFELKSWMSGIDYYKKAVDVLEQIRYEALSDAERRRLVQEEIEVFENYFFCAIQTNNYSLALAVVERGKTRNLADQIWRRGVSPHGVKNKHWLQYTALLNKTKELEYWMANGEIYKNENNTDAENEEVLLEPYTLSQNIREDLFSVRQSIAKCEDKFRKMDPNYLPFARPLEMNAIAKLSSSLEAVIVEFFVSTQGTYVFLIGPEDREIIHNQVIEIPEFDAQTLMEILIKTSEDQSKDGWLIKYQLFRIKKLSLTDWLNCMDATTHELYDKLMKPVHQRILQLYPECKRLILIPNKWLNLLPLHAAWWEDEMGERQYFLDGYDISYSPSCQVLRQCLAREETNANPAESLFAVRNPCSSIENGDLPFSEWEVEDACKYFLESKRIVLGETKATKQSVMENISFGGEILFSCHGEFNLTDAEQSRLRLHKDESLLKKDIVTKDLRGTWLVILSACETGLNDPNDLIDEYIGLSSSFLLAGASTVVSSLWAIDDFFTAILIGRLHGNLYEKKMSKGEALCEAQRWLKNLKLDEVKDILNDKIKELESVGKSRDDVKFLRKADILIDIVELSEYSTEKTFSNPHWWAAFQCIGAGWKPK